VRPYLKNNQRKKGWRCVSSERASKLEVLSLIPSIAEKLKKSTFMLGVE
jgi:hypothetical protein